MFSRLSFSLICLSAVMLSSGATATVVTYSGTTTGGPTFNRPIEDLSGLSGVGTAVRYDTRTFTVSQSGSYDFVTTGTFDTFSFVYSPTFNSAAPLSNAKIGNDDVISSSFNASGATLNLTAGTSYVLVNTGFANTDFGAYTTSIGGDGIISPILSSVAPSILTLSGDTIGKPTYNRPIEDLSSLSSVGTAVHYDVRGFTVSQNGAYTIAGATDYDSFLTIYGSSFNPTNPLNNALAADDDLLSGQRSVGIGANLMAGVNYFAVISGFANSDVGNYSLQIGGPGTAAMIGGSVPEPASWAMMLMGLGLVGGTLRRRKPKTVLVMS